MSVLKKIRSWLRSPNTERELVERAGQMVMQHIRLRGRCECLATRNEQGVDSFLLVLRTTMHVPAPDRVEMNYYFARKIREMLHTDAPIMLWIQDSKDASRVASMATISTARVVAQIRAANPSPQEQVAAELVQRLREEVQQGREERRRRQRHLEVPATDLAELGVV